MNILHQNSQILTALASSFLIVAAEPTSSNDSILKVPEKPSRKGGRSIKTLPFVVTSDEYIDMVEIQEPKKQDEENRKQKRREDLAEKKQKAKEADVEKKKQRLEKSAQITKIKQEAEEEKKAKKRKAESMKCIEQTIQPKRGLAQRKLKCHLKQLKDILKQSVYFSMK